MTDHSLRTTGFTLTELMIVVAVIGILSMIAYPSYIDHVRKARTADAMGVLLEAAQWMERQYTAENEYPSAADFASNSGLAKSPRDGDATYYGIVNAPDDDAQGYILTATAENDQLSYSRCKELTISNTGARDSEDADDCWQ